MHTVRLILGVAFLGATVCAAQAHNSGPSLRDRRQAACYTDAQRLCGQFVPDVAKVTACMKPRKAEVSEKCRALWDVDG